MDSDSDQTPRPPTDATRANSPAARSVDAGVLSPGEAIACGIVFLLGALLRTWRLNAEGLWLDEITCWVDVQQPLASLTQNLHLASQFLLKLSMVLFGTSNAALRLPGVVCGLTAVVVLWRALRAGFGRGVAFLGLLLAALSPYQVHYSRDANHYGSTLLCSALTFLLLRRFLARPRIATVALLALVQGAAWKIHPFNLALGASTALVLVVWAVEERGRWIPALRAWRAARPRLALALAAMFVAVLLWLGVLAEHRVVHILGLALNAATGETEGYSVTLTTYSRIAADLGGAFFDYRAGAMVAGGVLLVLAFAGVFVAFRSGQRALALFGLFVFLLPHLVLATVPFRHFFNTRYLAFQSPILLAFAAIGAGFAAQKAAAAGFRLRPSVLLGALAVFWCVNVVPSDLRVATRDRQPYESAAEALAAHAHPSDKVLCFPPWSELALRVSLERRGFHFSRLLTSRQLGGDSLATLFRLAYLAWLDDAPFYYYASYRRYDRDDSPEAWNWIQKNFDTVFEQPSGYVEDYARKVYDVGVYRFRYPGRLVMPFLESAVSAQRVPGADGEEWEAQPLFLAQGRYALELRRHGSTLDLSDWQITLDHEPQSLSPQEARTGNAPRLVLDVQADHPRLRLRPVRAGPAADEPSSLTLVFLPPPASSLTLLGWMAVDFGPFRYVVSSHHGRYQTLVLAQGAWADYLFDLPDAGPRSIRISANPPLGPMDVAVELDSCPLGLLAYPGDVVTERVISFQAGAGRHRLRLFAGRESLSIASGNGPPEGSGHLVITQIRIDPGSPGGDDRFDIPLPSALLRRVPQEASRPW